MRHVVSQSRTRRISKVRALGFLVPGPKSQDTAARLEPLQLPYPTSVRYHIPNAIHTILREFSRFVALF